MCRSGGVRSIPAAWLVLDAMANKAKLQENGAWFVLRVSVYLSKPGAWCANV